MAEKSTNVFTFFMEIENEMTETNCKSLRRENIVGSCLMILSMAAFAGEDSVSETKE